MSGAPSSVHFSVDDRDLDDAELWAVIDSAAASRSRKPLLALKNTNIQTSPVPNHSPVTSNYLPRTPRHQYIKKEDVRVSSDGEVLQEKKNWTHPQPHKMARFVDPGSCIGGNRAVVVRHPLPTPTVTLPSPYSSPDTGRFKMQEFSPPIRTAPLDFEQSEKEIPGHSLSGYFPSVSLFKQYQNAAMAILEKTDYTMISGNPFIKKSGWRKISFFFNVSFEIKDKSIEFDENRNVQRAEFVVRAFMQGGRFSDGFGSCERREKRFLKPNNDIPSTAETRAKNKACQDLLGIGEYRSGASSGHQ